MNIGESVGTQSEDETHTLLERFLDGKEFAAVKRSPDSLIRLYRSQVLPIIEYGCIVWDPHLFKHKQQLERIQLFATRIASKQWTESADTLNSHFCLPLLSLRRNYLKLLYMYKLVNSCVFCPYSLLQFHPNPNLHVSHEKQLVAITICKDFGFFQLIRTTGQNCHEMDMDFP